MMKQFTDNKVNFRYNHCLQKEETPSNVIYMSFEPDPWDSLVSYAGLPTIWQVASTPSARKLYPFY